jgi:beta-glucanase (GH16 family)
MNRNIIFKIGVLIIIISSACGRSTSKNRNEAKAEPNGWKLVWSDEFNYKGLPDSTKWNYEVGDNGWGNNEKEYYVEKSTANSYADGEKLHIVALHKKMGKSDYTSAKLNTYQKFSFQYGKIEVMAKLPAGKGTWPAIWMLPESLLKGTEDWPLCGEIDIMEHVGWHPGFIHVSLHSKLYNHILSTQVTHFEQLKDVFGTFHKYALELSADSMIFYIDDKLFYATAKGEDGRVSTNEGWPFDKPYYLILNLAIGGNWGGEIDDSIFPAEMQVDYVRIYQKTGK